MRKEDLPSESNQKPIKVGSEVMIIDGSYMINFENEETYTPMYYLDNEGIPIGHSCDIFEVIDINTAFPTNTHDMDCLCVHNNCKIKNKWTGEIWYCSHINIRNIESLI